MRILKATALALTVSLALGVGAASAGDMTKGHPWVHKHPICDFLVALFTLGHHHHAVKVSY